jgi:hypothetical protein
MAPSLSPLAAYLAERYAGRSVGTATIVRDADDDRAAGRQGAGARHRRLNPPVPDHGRRDVARAALNELIASDRAVYSAAGSETASGPNLFTIAQPGESLTEVRARHQATLLARHPAAYLREQLHGGVGTRDLPYVAITLARADPRVLAAWYPEGAPQLDAGLTPEDLPRFRGYVAALRATAEEYAALVGNPRALRRRIAERALPCQRSTRPMLMAGITYEVEEGLDRNALLGARRNGAARRRALTLWYPVPAGAQERGPLYCFTEARDPVTDHWTQLVVGAAELSLYDLVVSHRTDPSAAGPRCCPELQDRALLIASLSHPRLIRFHRVPGPFNFRPALPGADGTASGRHRRPRDGPSQVPLHLGGCLVPREQQNDADEPWAGYVLWVDERGQGRGWEVAGQQDLLRLREETRLWDRRTGTLRYPTLDSPAFRPRQPTPEELAQGLEPLMAYALTERLRGL